VISIGNVTMGGTGKTPLVIHVARLVRHFGLTPVVLSRGYGRISSPRTLVVPPHAAAEDDPARLGDEPCLMRRSVRGLWLGISPDRFEAGSAAAEAVTNATFILDDGFQHRRLKRDLDIVLLDSTQPFADNLLFPAGSLREPLTSLRRCGAIVINGPRGDVAAEALRAAASAVAPGIPTFRCVQRIRAVLPWPTWKSGAEGPAAGPAPVSAVAAIGNPARFRRDVAAAGMDVRAAHFFRDHHCPSRDQWLRCWERARALGAQYLLTTEKDAVKITGDPAFPLLVACQSTEMDEAAEFEQLIRGTADH